MVFSLWSLFALSLYCTRESSLIWCSLFVLSLFSLSGSNGVQENSVVFSLCSLFELPLTRCELLRSEFWKCLVEVQQVCVLEFEKRRTINHGRGGSEVFELAVYFLSSSRFPFILSTDGLKKLNKNYQKPIRLNDWSTAIYSSFPLRTCFYSSCFWVRLRTKLMGKAILLCRCETWIVNAKSLLRFTVVSEL